MNACAAGSLRAICDGGAPQSVGVLVTVEQGLLEEFILRGWLEAAVTREEDRALFGLGRFVWTDTWVRRNGQWQIVAAKGVAVPIKE